MSELIKKLESEFAEKFTRASGPGGQNVNKVSTAVELRFNINSPQLSSYIISRLKVIAANQINEEGVLLIKSSESRFQELNRQIVREKLALLIAKASIVEKKRKKTKPTKSSKEKRLSSKKRDGLTKSSRGKVSW